VLPSGEKVILDPESTVQRIMLIFYALINVGAFFAIATTYSEKYVGYWLAFLTPGIIYFLLPLLLWYLNNKLVKYPPDGSALTKVWKIVTVAFKYNKGNVFAKGFWERAKPSNLHEQGITTFMNKPIAHQWTDKDAEDVRRTLVACAVFLYFPIYNCNDGKI
jgi:dipeptide/tripeptide permease